MVLLKEQLDAPIRLLIFIGALVLGATVMVGEKQAEVDGFGGMKSLWFLTKVANVMNYISLNDLCFSSWKILFVKVTVRKSQKT